MQADTLYYYMGSDSLYLFLNDQKLSVSEKLNYLINNKIPYRKNSDTLEYFRSHNDTCIDIVDYIREKLAPFKLLKGKKKCLFIDNNNLKYNNVVLHDMYFSFIPAKTSNKILNDIKKSTDINV